MADLYSSILNLFLKIAYIIPFIVFYALNRRINKYTKKYMREFRIGLALVILNIIFLFVFTILSINRVIVYTQLNELYTYQIVMNMPLLIGYALLFIGVKKNFVTTPIVNNEARVYQLLTITLLASSLIALIAQKILLAVNILTYDISILLLGYSYLIIHKILKSLDEKYSNLAFIGAFVIILDPALYTYLYSNVLTDVSEATAEVFLNSRIIVYISGLIGALLVMIPNIKFLLKLSVRKAINYSDKDTLSEHVMKRLINETQNVYGSATLTLFYNACSSYLQEYNKEVKYNDTLNLENLDFKEQKEFLKVLFRVFMKALNKDLFMNLLAKIVDQNNESLINESIPKEHVSIPIKIKKDKGLRNIKEIK